MVFEGDYLRRHVHHGYAVTVHAAQGATADRRHAVPRSPGRGRRRMAMTRGRDTNCVYLYERIAGEGDHEHADTPTVGWQRVAAVTRRSECCAAQPVWPRRHHADGYRHRRRHRPLRAAC